MTRPSPVDEWLTDDGLALVRGWARDGLAGKQIAENMGVTERSLYRWKESYPTFAEALTDGREIADRHVENALYKRAVGYAYTETKTVTDATGETTVTVTEKQQAPDTLAQIFWLKNRKPADWRDRREVELDGAVGLVQIVDDIATDPLIG